PWGGATRPRGPVPEGGQAPAVARSLGSAAQIDGTLTRAHGREGGVGSAIRHIETQSFIERDGLGHIAYRKRDGANVLERPVWHARTSRIYRTLTTDLMRTLGICASAMCTCAGIAGPIAILPPRLPQSPFPTPSPQATPCGAPPHPAQPIQAALGRSPPCP